MYHWLSFQFAWPGPNFKGCTIFTEKWSLFHWKFGPRDQISGDSTSPPNNVVYTHQSSSNVGYPFSRPLLATCGKALSDKYESSWVWLLGYSRWFPLLMLCLSPGHHDHRHTAGNICECARSVTVPPCGAVPLRSSQQPKEQTRLSGLAYLTSPPYATYGQIYTDLVWSS